MLRERGEVGLRVLGGPRTPRTGGRPGAVTLPVLLLVAAFVVLSIGTPLLGLRVFSGADLLLRHAPWSADAPVGFAPDNDCIPDTVDAVLPGRSAVVREAREGDLALWNPYGSGGSALAAVPDPGAFSPVALPWFLLPDWLAPGYVKLLELGVSVGFTFLFLRRVGLSRPAGLLGGVLFSASGFMVVWTNWPQTNVAAFIPALFWATERFAQQRSLRAALPIPLVIASMLLGGFPAVTALTVYAAAAYLLVRLAAERPGLRAAGTSVVGAGAALLLGVALTAVQVLPFVRRVGDLDLQRDFAGVKLPLQSLVTVAVPNAFGSCADAAHYYFGPINQIEVQSAFGSAGLVLVVLALLTRRVPGAARGVRGFFLAMTVVVVAVTFVGGPFLAAAQELPTVGSSFIGRSRALLGFALAVLAALGFDRLLRQPWSRRRGPALLALLAWAAVSVAGLLAVLSARRSARVAGEVAYVDREVLLAVAAAGLVLAAAVVCLVRPRLRAPALVAAAAVVVAQSTAFAGGFWPEIDRSEFYPRTPVHRFLDANLGHDRYGATGYAMYPGTSTYYEQRSVVGHSFTAPEWKQLLLTVDPKAFASPTFSLLTGLPQGGGAAVLDRLAVRWFVQPETSPVPGRTEQVAADGTVRLGDGAPLEAPVPAGAVRAVGVSFPEGYAPPAGEPAVLAVALVGPDGRQVASGRRELRGPVGPQPFLVPVPDAPELSGARAVVTLRTSGEPAAVAASGGAPALTAVLAEDDGLRLAFADGAVVYERTRSLPRVRWAGRATVVPDEQQRLAAMTAPAQGGTVLLSEAGAEGGGGDGRVDVLTDDVDRIQVRVSAASDGYLVVADALTRGWAARVGDEPVEVVEADHALGAVAVPAGEHTVTLEYAPEGRRTGLVVTSAALVVLAALTALALRRRRAPADPPAGAAAAPAGAPGPPAVPVDGRAAR